MLILGLLLSPTLDAAPRHHAPTHGHSAKHAHHASHASHSSHASRHHSRRHDDDAEDEPVAAESPPVVRHEYDDYGVKGGRCDSHRVTKILGGAALANLSGVADSHISEGNQAGAMVDAVAGTVRGVSVGEQIGKSMDTSDRYCTGRVLDYTPDRSGVHWVNPHSRVDYVLTPLRSYKVRGRECRDFSTQVKYSNQRDVMNHTACRGTGGDWEVR
jgi:surface antigen